MNHQIQSFFPFKYLSNLSPRSNKKLLVLHTKHDSRAEERYVTKDVSVDFRVEHNQGDKIVPPTPTLYKISAYLLPQIQIHTKEEVERHPPAN